MDPASKEADSDPKGKKREQSERGSKEARLDENGKGQTPADPDTVGLVQMRLRQSPAKY